MKRKQFTNLSGETECIECEEKITITTETWDRVNNGQQYQREDIVAVASCLMDTHGYDVQQQLKVLGGERPLKEWLESVKNFNVHQNAYFCIYNIQENHWVVFSFLEYSSHIVVLYKDSREGDILPEIKKTISEKYSENSLLFKSNNTNNESSVDCCGPMCLKNLEITLEGLNGQKGEFIARFESNNFCSSHEVANIRENIKNILFTYVRENIFLTVGDLQRNKEFIDAMKELVLECVKHGGMNNPCQQYVNACEETGNPANPNRDKVKDARKSVLESDHVKSLIKRCSGESSVESSRTIYTTKNDIEIRFPEQSKAFKELFTWIMKFKDNEARKSFLETLSDALSLEYKDIEKFFEARRKKEEENVQLVEEDDSLKIRSIEELERVLPPLMQNDDDFTHVGEGVRTVEELLKELSLGSTWSAKYIEHEDNIDRKKQTLRESVSRVHGAWNDRWRHASPIEIREWAAARRSQSSQMERDENSREDVETTLAVICRAHQLVTGAEILRDTQILAALVCLLGEKGTLCQMGTGEGKTAVIAMLAAANVLLYNEQVDVITTNHVLAYEGFRSRRLFFELLGITVSCNASQHQRGQADEGGSAARACYNADVVYGDMATFQFDYLRHECERQGTRGNRSFGRVIVDEVDSMLIDEASRIAKVASPFPGMDSLRYIHIKIWVALTKANRDVSETVMEKMKLKWEETKEEMKSNELKLIEDFDNFSVIKGITNVELNAKGEELRKKRENFRKRCVSVLKDCMNEELINDIKQRIKKSKPTEIDLIPAHLRDYASRMEDKWIDSALYAMYDCNENEQYVLRTDEVSKETVVIPVDYNNTGVTLKNTQWSNGLHQFVQLKHNLRVTVESLHSSFISNLGYIKKYGNKIWGLTGTLGSDVETQLLSDAYDVSHAKIPTYKPRKFTEMTGLWVSDRKWKYKVTFDALKYTEKREGQLQRSVLIICKTIRDVLELEQTLKIVVEKEGQERKVKIKTYCDETGSKIVTETVGPGEIIIATNIAGRGTDLTTTGSLEKNGGLHVIVTFLPANQRVEDQAFGRTGRQGNAGSAQIVLRHSDVYKLGFDISWRLNFSSIKSKRDKLEQIRIEEVRANELELITFEDAIFLEFLKVYINLAVKSDNDASVWFLAMDLKEMWAFWLNEKDFSRNHLRKTANVEFQDFLKKASKILGDQNTNKKGEIAFNPYYSIQQAEQFLTRGSNQESEKALWHAIDLDPKNSGILHGAFYKLFEVEVEKGSQLRERTIKALRETCFVNAGREKDETYKTKAKDALQKAKESLNNEITYMANYFKTENENGNNEDSDSSQSKEENIERYFECIINSVDSSILLKQLKSKYAVLEYFYGQVQSLLDKIQESSNKEDGSTSGTALTSRVPIDNFTRETDLPLSLGTEIEEIKQLGLEMLYAVRDVHDVPKNIIRSAQGQIAAGLFVASCGALFPPALVFTAPLSSILISEGICDIVLNVVSQGYEEFSKADYIKGKVIGYAISITTMGLGVILKNLAILDEAIKFCKSAVEFLRKWPRMKFILEKIANLIERLQRYFEKLRLLALINNSNTAIVHSTKQVLFSVCTDTLQRSSRNILGSVITERIVNVQLKQMLTFVLPDIQRLFKDTVNRHIEDDDLKYITKSDLQTLTHKILNKSGIFNILVEVLVGLLRHSSSWDLKLAALATDAALTGYKIYTYPSDFCSELKKELKNEQKMGKESGESFEDLKIIILETVSKEIYSLAMQILGKYTNTLFVSQVCNFVSSFDFLETQEGLVERQGEILGLQYGARDEEIYRAYKAYTA